MFDIQEELKKLPQKPGVYLMKDENGHIIYVGKAVNLKNRVRQYFQSSRNQTAKTRSMVPNIREFEYIVTDSEMEALLLECNLIKKHHPYYNILLKDDKSYPYIKVTVQEMFPRIFITRRMEKDIMGRLRMCWRRRKPSKPCISCSQSVNARRCFRGISGRNVLA